MKMLSAVLFSAFLCASLQAQSLAKVNYHPGFVMNPTSIELEIQETGDVVATYKSYDHDSSESTTDKKVIATINADVVAKIVKMLDSLKEAPELVDLNEGEPRMSDGPTYFFHVTIQGESVKIGSEMQGHTMIDKSYKTRFLKKTLEGLMALAQLN